MTVYIESVDDDEMDAIEEALGRRYAAHIGVAWPIEPDVIGPGLQPPDLSLYYMRQYRRFLRHRSGGVVEIDSRAAAALADWEGDFVRIGDGSDVQLDLAARMVAHDALTQDSQDVVDGVTQERTHEAASTPRVR